MTNLFVRTMCRDTSGNIWIGTVKGLNCFNPHTKQFKHFTHDLTNHKSISNNIIECIEQDSNGCLWVGTMYGLNRYETNTESFTSYYTRDGLPRNTIKGLIGDEVGNIWLSTSQGLSKFDPKTETSTNYTVEDGLASNAFAAYSYCKLSDGYMMFGGNNGITMFHPSDIRINRVLPKVSITDFKVNNTSVTTYGGDSPLNKHISQVKELTLTHTQSVFSFDFVAMSYISQEQNEYKYMLEGFDSHWNYVKHKHTATYTNLNPGSYIFKVKASNNDGLWNDSLTSIKVNILPPMWRTWWAYSFYIILFLGLLFLVLYIRASRLSDKRTHELDMLKINFFANVSHEFRTPLTLILSPLEQLLKNSQVSAETSSLKMMHRNTQRLLTLVNQLLDFQKIGSGEMKFRPSMVEVVSFVREISQSFANSSSKQNIDFIFKSNVSECYLSLDTRKTENLVLNLLSNAFKFAPDGGEVSIDIILQDSDDRSLVINVRDNGPGIDITNHEKIFTKFFRAENEGNTTLTGSGIGLFLVKEYVELHKGSITVDSSLGEGACFIVKFPIYDGLEFTQEEQQCRIVEASDSIEANFLGDVRRRSNKPLLLLVEDNLDFRHFLKERLSPSFKIIEAVNGVEGWEFVSKYIPDLVISDVMMPIMDGNELCAKIKADQRTSHIPVILLTAQSAEQHLLAGFESGADQFVSKPFSFSVLEYRIASLLKQRHKLQQSFSRKIDVNPSEIAVTSIDEKFVNTALQFVEKNIDNTKLSVEDLSRELDISRVHLYRKVSAITGKSPSDFIRSIRLKRAAQLLATGKLSIAEVAYQVGFSNPKYFTKCFKAEFDMIPSAYIASKRE